MKDMRMSSEEKSEMMTPSAPDYPYGLCISLSEDEIDKLGIDFSGVEPGTLLDIDVMAKVTSKSENDNGDGPQRRLELQIIMMDVENEDNEDKPSRSGKEIVSKLYK